MEPFSVLLAFCEGNPPVILRVDFFCLRGHTVEQTGKLLGYELNFASSCLVIVTLLGQVSGFKQCISPLHSFTVPLQCPYGRHLPAVNAVQGDCHWGLKAVGNSYWSAEPMMQWGTRQLQTIFRQPIAKGGFQPIGGYVSYPTDSHTATRLGPCSSLSPRSLEVPPLYCFWGNHAIAQAAIK